MIENVMNKFEDAFKALDELRNTYDIEVDEWQPKLNSFVLENLFKEFNFKFNCFSYSDYSYRCGSSDGYYSYLITYLSEEEVKERMRVFAEKDVKGYCHHAFLRSLENEGMVVTSGESTLSDLYGNSLVNYEISFDNIEEKDILSPEKYSAIIAAREEVARLKREKEEAERLAQIEKKEREQYERLRKKFE